MAFHHRKLLNESDTVDPETLAKLCDLFCDSTRNPDAVCPSQCLDFCPPFCITSLSLIPPPPLPSPETPGAVFTPPLSNHHYRLPIFLTISLAVLAATFFFFTCYTIHRFHSAWRNSRRRPNHPSRRRQPDENFNEDHHEPVVDHHVWYIRTIGLQQSVINAITIVNYNKGEGLIEGTDCSVCLNEFEESETLRLLPKCNHAFHLPCIDTWLRSHTNCPMCRAPIVIGAPPVSQESVVQNSGRVEEEDETRDELDHQPSELRIEVEDEGNSSDRSGLDGMQQPMRRSVSLDSLSAKMISSAISNDFSEQLSDDLSSDNQLVLKRDDLSIVQTGSSSMRRSLSCSAKVFLSRHSSSKNRDSIIPELNIPN